MMRKVRLPEKLRDPLRWLPRPAVYAAALAVVLALALAVRHQVTRPPGLVDLPAFDGLETSAMKAAFFDLLRPIARYHNQRIAEERAWLLEAAEKASLGWFEQRRLQRLAEQYGVDLGGMDRGAAIDLLKRRVDNVPESLVLIQAAKESGWGRSRFAREGNALFGERCFDEGCGIVPGARPEEAGHEVANFPTVYAAVGSYIRNLNTHPEYTEFRHARRQLRANGEELSGIVLAEHLGRYSERGDRYVLEIVSMIRQNDLETD